MTSRLECINRGYVFRIHESELAVKTLIILSGELGSSGIKPNHSVKRKIFFLTNQKTVKLTIYDAVCQRDVFGEPR